MKLEFKVKELSHEDIVEILSSACYANENMSIRYNKNLLKDVTRHGSDCLEDRAADLLLAGKHIYVIDWEIFDEPSDLPLDVSMVLSIDGFQHNLKTNVITE